MSSFVADRLPESLLARLSADRAVEHADRAIVICTVDPDGWPHPAMTSSLELVARDARNVRLAMHAASRTTRNLRANGRLTVIVADDERVNYIKGDVLVHRASLQSAPDLSSFNMRVDSVLEDNPAAYEQARLTSGLRVARRTDAAHAQQLIAELVAD